MTHLEALFLGALQGLTEFLPISSDGHLLLAETFLQFSMEETDLLYFDILLHAASLLALVSVYWRVWFRLVVDSIRGEASQRRLLLFLILATIPAALAGMFLKNAIAHTFRSPLVAGICLGATGLFLLFAERFPAKKTARELSGFFALLIGIAQALALLPGLSRSGLTIGTARIMKLTRREAVDFSFLMAAPIIAGAVLVALLDIIRKPIILPELPIIASGFFSSFIVSVIAIVFMRRFIVLHDLRWFSLYLLPISLFTLAWYFMSVPAIAVA